MPFDIGEAIRAIALGGSGFLEGRRQRGEDARRQRLEDEEEKRRRIREKRDAELHALRALALKRELNAPKAQPTFRFSGGGVSGEAMSMEEAQAAAALLNPPDPPEQGTIRVTVDGITREFPDTPEGEEAARQFRQRNRDDDGGLTGRGTSRTGELARQGLAAAEENPSSMAASSILGIPNPFGPKQRIRREPDEDTQLLIDDITRRNKVRMEVIADGITDPDEVEAEVDRRMGR